MSQAKFYHTLSYPCSLLFLFNAYFVQYMNKSSLFWIRTFFTVIICTHFSLYEPSLAQIEITYAYLSHSHIFIHNLYTLAYKEVFDKYLVRVNRLLVIGSQLVGGSLALGYMCNILLLISNSSILALKISVMNLQIQ